MSFKFDNSYATLPDSWFERRKPTPLKHSHLISFNAPLAQQLGLNPCDWSADALVDAFTSEQLMPGMDPIAMKYTGHQFGIYNPDLGDGRGLLLGEHIAPDGQRWDLHLKGAGQTRYSRFADGRAVLRSSIREYLVSEAMHGLGIPTTRALAIFGSGQYTMRNGAEPCAMVLRVTPCHIRFGHFEYFYYSRQHDDLQILADYVIERFYPEFQNFANPYLAMYQEVVKRSAHLVALWQSYGFVHGVMNTDNMSIIGETFDYGPFTFMDRYEPNHIANKNDHQGRYAFSNQPSMMQWNLAALAQALLPLIPKEALEQVLEGYAELYFNAFYTQMRQRLALPGTAVDHRQLIDQFLNLLAEGSGDLNRSIRLLVENMPLDDAIGTAEGFADWLVKYQDARAQEPNLENSRIETAKSKNPVYTLRNYMCQEAIRDAQDGDYRQVNDLLALVREPTKLSKSMAEYAGTPPDWAAGIMLTCSS